MTKNTFVNMPRQHCRLNSVELQIVDRTNLILMISCKSVVTFPLGTLSTTPVAIKIHNKKVPEQKKTWGWI